jgi:hypothetical protein
MGAWSNDPWGSDEAADWFHRFWKEKNFDLLVNEIENLDPVDERFDSLRAACYLLEVLGISYVWPVDYLDDLRKLLTKAIELLRKMCNPPDETWSYLEMCDDDPGVVVSLHRQIANLEARLAAVKK